MAGLIAKLFGGTPQPDAEATPQPGIGGYTPGAGPTGQTGFPGSTKQTRTFRVPPNTPREAKIMSDTDSGFEQGLTGVPQVRRASYRGEIPGASLAGPQGPELVATPQPQLTYNMQNVPGTQYGGQVMKTQTGNQVVGGLPLSGAAAAGGHSAQDTQTPWRDANVVISGNVPGAQNVRNQVAQRYKYPAGITHTYKSAPRADQAPVLPGGQATDGNVKLAGITQDVTVETRNLPFNGGNLSWVVLREMPYGGRGNGARGADLSGQRRYSTGQDDQFWNAGQGDYGVERQRGNKRPVSFQQPAPWTSNFYDTTQSVGTYDDPNQNPSQIVNSVYVSPSGGRASNSTGRQ